MTSITSMTTANGSMIPKVLLVVRCLLALAFFAASLAKLSGVEAMVEEFEKVGLGQWFRYFTGGVELAGALLLVWRPTAALGGLLLLCVCIGALIAHVTVLHGDIIHCIVMGAIAAWLAWSYRSPRTGTSA